MRILSTILKLVLVPGGCLFTVVITIILLLLLLTTYSCNPVVEPDNGIIELSYKIDSLSNLIEKQNKKIASIELHFALHKEWIAMCDTAIYVNMVCITVVEKRLSELESKTK